MLTSKKEVKWVSEWNSNAYLCFSTILIWQLTGSPPINTIITTSFIKKLAIGGQSASLVLGNIGEPLTVRSSLAIYQAIISGGCLRAPQICTKAKSYIDNKQSSVLVLQLIMQHSDLIRNNRFKRLFTLFKTGSAVILAARDTVRAVAGWNGRAGVAQDAQLISWLECEVSAVFIQQALVKAVVSAGITI